MDNIFLNGTNYLISLDYKKAKEFFLDNYKKFPNEINYLHGFIISSILLNNFKNDKEELRSFFERECSVSALKNKINLIHEFIKSNDYFENLKNNVILFNMGIFLKKHFFQDEARIYFDICLSLNPEDRKSLTVLAEYALMENDTDRCIKMLAEASKL
jgi:hypothetical protein